jgi:hypothetical protein
MKEMTGRTLDLGTQYKVSDGYWNLLRVERRSFGFLGVRYVPIYRWLSWDHAKFKKLRDEMSERARN